MNPELPGSYVNLLVEVLKQKNFKTDDLLNEFNISLKNLEAPFWYVDFNIFNNLLNKAIVMSQEPALSIHMAKLMKVTCYGHIGIAASASENLGLAINVLEEFIKLNCSTFQPELKVEGDFAYLYFNQPLENFNLNIHGITFLVIGFAQIIESLAQQKLDIYFEFQQDKSLFLIENNLWPEMKVEFNADFNRLVFRKEDLSLPLKTADALVSRLAKRQCEKYSQKYIPKRNQFDKNLKTLVKGLLANDDHKLSTLNQIADQLKISERTLQRHLAIEGTTFQIILSETRKDKAEKLLKQNILSIQEISNLLGYADVSHFSRAFKKWTSFTPKAYRNTQKSYK
ncbi:AraC family transcriptional regulator ligand-binding domain-containing protein [bacterium SPL81]|nr:AraC family transcriptional regulator ligand-binding domain-containing protein [Acinetobacter baumannii]